MITKHKPPRRRRPKCHHCGKIGHIQRNGTELVSSEKEKDECHSCKQKAKHAEVLQRDASSSESDNVGLMAGHALSVSQKERWIVDSGATSHMSTDRKNFTELHALEKPLDVTLGDGHSLKATGKGYWT